MKKSSLSQRILLYINVIVSVELWKQAFGEFSGSGTGTGTRIALPFLQFGDNKKYIANDTSDGVSEAISIPLGFPFGSTIQNLAFVGDNGIISFGEPFLLWEPEPFPGTVEGVRSAHVVAPYWSDNDIRREGTVSYEVFEFQKTGVHGDEVLTTVSNYIMEEFGNTTNFLGVYMILAEWNNVHPFPHGIGNTDGLSPSIESFIAKSNTYQAVVITNLEESYAIFIYNCDQLQWSGIDTFPTIGYNSPSDSTNAYTNHLLTAQEGATEIACNPNPVCNNIVYQISKLQGVVEEQKRMCVEWYLSDFDKFEESDIVLLDQIAPPCPCQLSQVQVDRYFEPRTSNKTTVCFTTRFLLLELGVRECCYSMEPLTLGALITDTENGGSLLLSPTTSESLLQNNRIPQSLCCPAKVGLCDMYYKRRPPNFCDGYDPSTSSGLGDPHFMTLDGVFYTFNGVGEYVLVRSKVNDLKFQLQGRTTAIMNSGATVFSAFAVESNETNFQISSSNGEFNIAVGGTDMSSELAMVGSSITSPLDLYIFERNTMDSLQLLLHSGIALTFSQSNEIFSFIINLPPTLNGQTEGLLGSLNGNISDDLIFRNGTLLPTTSTDAEKHMFGQSWQVSDTESIFQYMPGQGVSNFSDPNHIPPFLDDIRSNLVGNSTLFNVCGNNAQCLFDFGQTGSEAVGMATMEFMQEVMEEVIISESFPPSIIAPGIFMATVEIDSIYSFTVTGSNDVTVAINGQESLPPNTNFTRSGNTFTLVWNPIDINEEFNVTIIAISERNARALFVPRVQLCGCENGGNCTTVGVANLQLPFNVLNCDCPAAYDGNICEDDADGCTMISCLAGQSCMDFRAPMAGAMCTCPVGYNEINFKCIDDNECDDAATNNCTELQSCVNTPGSFSCSCLPGYRPSSTSPLLCEDIDECEVYNDCHHFCINTNGSFNCSCRQGFELLPNNTCGVTQDARCPSNNACAQLCNLDSEMTWVCSCYRGYQLNTDNISCSDINECDITGSCSQNCINTNGSFLCSCRNGYSLDSDGRTCNDVNECLQLTDPPCSNRQLCRNTMGGYECVCPPGTVANGTDCLSIIITSSITPSLSSTTLMPTVTDTESGSDGLASGEIAGIVIGSIFGGIIVLTTIILIAIWVNRHRTKSITIRPTLIMYKNRHDDFLESRNVYSGTMTSNEMKENENETTTHL